MILEEFTDGATPSTGGGIVPVVAPPSSAGLSLHAEDIPSLLEEQDFKTATEDERSQLLDDALSAVYENDVARSDDPEAQSAFHEMATAAQDRIAPGVMKQTGKAIGHAAIGAVRGMGAMGVVQAALNPVVSAVTGRGQSDVGKAMGAGLRNYGEAGKQLAKEKASSAGWQLDSAIEEFKTALDGGAVRGDAYNQAHKKLAEKLDAYHGTDYARTHGVSAPENLALLGRYVATRNPAVWREFRRKMLLTKGKAEINARLAELGKDPLGQMIVEGSDPLIALMTVVPALRGVRAAAAVAQGSKLAALGKSAAIGASAGAAGHLVQDPSASLGEVAQSGLAMGVVAGGMHAIPEGLKRLLPGQAKVQSSESGVRSQVSASESAAAPPGVMTQTAPVATEPGAAVTNPPPAAGSSPATGTVPEVGVRSPESGVQSLESRVQGPEAGVPAGDGTPSRAAWTGLPERAPTTQILNAATDAERAARGEPPQARLPAETEALWLDQARRRLTADPEAGQKLISELLAKPRPHTAEEAALLLLHKKQLKDAIVAAVEVANDASNPTAQAETQVRLARLLDARAASDKVNVEAGSATGKALRARQMGLDDSFSLPELLAVKRAMKGDDLSPAEIRETTASHAALERAKAELEALEEKTAADAVGAAVSRVQGAEQAAEAAADKTAPATSQQLLLDQARAKRAEALERLRQTGAGGQNAADAMQQLAAEMGWKVRERQERPQSAKRPESAGLTEGGKVEETRTPEQIAAAEKQQRADEALARELATEDAANAGYLDAITGKVIEVPHDWRGKGEWDWLEMLVDEKGRVPSYLRKVIRFKKPGEREYEQRWAGEEARAGEGAEEQGARGQRIIEAIHAAESFMDGQMRHHLNMIRAEREAMRTEPAGAPSPAPDPNAPDPMLARLRAERDAGTSGPSYNVAEDNSTLPAPNKPFWPQVLAEAQQGSLIGDPLRLRPMVEVTNSTAVDTAGPRTATESTTAERLRPLTRNPGAGGSFPNFQGVKRKMTIPTALAILRKWTGEQRRMITTVVDLFGGGGAFGWNVARFVFPNLKKIIINELSRARAEKIEAQYREGNQFAAYARLPATQKLFAEAARKVNAKRQTDAAGEGTSWSVVGEAIEGIMAEADPSEVPMETRVVIRTMLDDPSREGPWHKKKPLTAEALTQWFVQTHAPVAERLHRSYVKFTEQGGELKVTTGDAYKPDLLEEGEFYGRDKMVFADPPYFGTTGYKGKEIVGADIYQRTADLITHLREKDTNVVYTDEAWWLQKEATKEQRKKGEKPAPKLTAEQLRQGSSILDQIRNSIDISVVTDKIAGRYESLGLNNAFERAAERRADHPGDVAGDVGGTVEPRLVEGDGLPAEGTVARGDLEGARHLDPDFAPFMDATGLLTAASIVRVMARQARDFADFSSRALRRFGEWISPHVRELWRAAKAGARAVQTYLHGMIQAARKTSEQGGTSKNPVREAKRQAREEAREEASRLAKEWTAPAGTAEPPPEVTLGASVVAEYGGTFENFYTRMQAMGARMRNPRQIYDQSRALAHEWTLMANRAARKMAREANGPSTRISKNATPLEQAAQRSFIERIKAGTSKSQTELVDQVRADVLPHFPDATVRDVRDAISRYGKPKLPSKDEIARQAAEMRAQMRLVSALEDAEAGTPPKKSGLQKSPESATVKDLRKQVKKAMQRSGIIPSDTERQFRSQLQSYKSRTRTAIAQMEAQLRSGKYEKPTRRQLQHDAESTTLLARREAIKLQIRREIEKIRLANRTRPQKIMDMMVKWRRGFLLSGYTTLGKLVSAAYLRQAITPVEEFIGAGIGRALPKLAAGAPREGGMNIRAEAMALRDGFLGFMREFGRTIRTGKSEIDLAHGKIDLGDLNPSVMDFFGHLHAALKLPAKLNEFSRSYAKRMEWEMRQGADGSDPGVQMRVAQAAYRDANRSIFMNDNFLSNKFKLAVHALENHQGDNAGWARSVAYIMKMLLPIVRVPTNIVGETANLAIGLPRGGIELAKAMRVGLDTLKPEERDAILRHLKKGSLGAALITLGFFSPNNAGGYWSAGDKRKEKDVKAGHFRFFGWDVPHWLTHAPAFEAVQFGATMRRVVDQMKGAHPIEQAGAATLAAGLGLLDEVPFMGATRDISKMAQTDDEGKRARGRLLQSLVVPIGISQAAAQLDRDASGHTVRRRMQTYPEFIQGGIPVWREALPVYRPPMRHRN